MQEDSIAPLKSIIKGSTIVLLGIFFSKIFGYLYRILVARIGPEEYGLISLALGITGILTSISFLGLNTGIVRYIPYFKGRNEENNILLTIRSALKTTFVLSGIFSILVYLFSEQISISLFNNSSLIPVLKIMSISIFLGALGVILINTLQAFQKVVYQVTIKNILENIVKLGITFALIYWFSLGVIGAAYAYVIALGFTTLVSALIINKKVFRFLTFKKIRDNIGIKKEILKYSLPLMLQGLLVSLVSWTDTLMIGAFSSASSAGIYNAALPTAQLLYIIPYVFTFLFLPILTELYSQGKLETLKTIYIRVTKWVFFLNFLVLSFFFLFSKSILLVLFGRDYLSASIPLIILSTGFFLGYLPETTERMFMIFKRTKLILLFSVLITSSNIILNYLLIPKYDLIGASIATASSFILMFILALIWGKRIIKVNNIKIKYFLNILPLILILLGSKYLIRNYFTENVITLLFIFALFSIFTVVILMLTKTFEKEDILFIKLIIKKIKSHI